VVAGKPLDHTYKTENVELVSKGCCNLARHIGNARKYGVPVVVAINMFASDTQAELDAVRSAALEAGMSTAPCTIPRSRGFLCIPCPLSLSLIAAEGHV
jgi:formyltetrahydrofolate synthetase